MKEIVDMTSQEYLIVELSKQLAALELVVICAQDIVAAWPETTMRTLGNMTKRVDTLRQALAEVAK
jgi:hypothetical protein